MNPRVFIDSDALISSLISAKGAAYALIQDANIEKFISYKSQEEVKKVVEELNLDETKLDKIMKNKFRKKQLKAPLEEIKENYSIYVKRPQ